MSLASSRKFIHYTVYTSNPEDPPEDTGSGTKKTPFITLRLIEVRSGKTWHSYLTSVLDPHVFPPYVVADLYRRRWRIEEAFNTVKRLLGLSYLALLGLWCIRYQAKLFVIL